MSNISLNYAQIIDPLSFKSINLAKIYIGEYGTLPNPANASTWKQAYFVNPDGTRTAASQPIRTNAAGYAVDGSGNIKTIQVDGGYSLLVQDQYGATKFSQSCSAANSGAVLEFDTIAGFTGALDGSVCYFKGRDTVGDGGGGLFWYSASSTQPTDGGTVFEPAAGGGRIFRQGWTAFGFNGELSVKYFGAVGDGVVDDSNAIQLAFNSGATSVHFSPNKQYVCNNVRIPYIPNRVIEGNDAKLICTLTGVNDCCLLYSNVANPGDTTRATDGNTLTINNLVFQGTNDLGVGLRYIVANHLWVNNCRFGGFAEAVRVGSCNDIHFNSCLIASKIGVHCILKEEDPYSASFAEVSFNDGIYINGGTLYGSEYGLKYDGSLAEGVFSVNKCVITGSSVAGIYAKDFYSAVIENSWTEFFPAGSRQIWLAPNAVGFESFEAVIRNNFFTVYETNGIPGNVSDYVIYGTCQHLLIEGNYFQNQTMPAQKVIYYSCGATYSVPTRTNINIVNGTPGSGYGTCVVNNSGSNSMIIGGLELQGIFTDTVGNEYYAFVESVGPSSYTFRYFTATPVYRKAADIQANQFSPIGFASDGSFITSAPSTPLTTGIGSYTPMASAIPGGFCEVTKNTFNYGASPVNSQKLFGKFFGNLIIESDNAYREI